MNKHADRLIELINHLNLNTRSFAIACGFSQPTTIYSVLKNNSKLTTNTLDKICNRFPQVNKDWLLTGYGNMFNTSTRSSDDLTVTAKQVIDKLDNQTEEILDTIVPKMLRHDLVTKADGLLNELQEFLKEFKIIKTELVEIKQDIDKIHGKLTEMEYYETVKAVKDERKKKNGGIDLN